MSRVKCDLLRVASMLVAVACGGLGFTFALNYRDASGTLRDGLESYRDCAILLQ